EGNRRLAALKMLSLARANENVPSRWRDIVAEYDIPDALFKKIPYLEIDKREDVSAFLGFRHVTGIKEWRPAEKAEYIAHLIENYNMTYDDVRRKIGSKTPTVRQNY